MKEKLNFLNRFFKYQIYFIAVKIVSFFLRFKKKPRNNTVTIIKYDGIGDFVLFLDMARGLREYYKDKKLVLSCPSVVSGLAKSSGYFDEIVCIPKREFSLCNLRKLIQKSKKLECELLIHPTISRDFNSEILARIVNANQKISVSNNNNFSDGKRKWTKKTYCEIIDVNMYDMVLQQNRDMLHFLGHKSFVSKFPRIRTYRTNIFKPLNEYYILFIGGSMYQKLWPIDRMYEIAKFISDTTSLICVLCGVESDLEQEVYFNKSKDFFYYSYLGKTNLYELIDLVSSAKFVFGNDTSIIHIATALGVSAICVSSAISSKRFYPYQSDIKEDVAPIAISCDVNCQGCSFYRDSAFKCLNDPIIKDKFDCISNISVMQVKNTINDWIKNIKN